MHASPLLQEFNSGPASLIFLWVVLWAVIGGVVTPRIYRKKDLDASSATLYGAIAGAGTGPLLPAWLWYKTPDLNFTWNRESIPSILIYTIIKQDRQYGSNSWKSCKGTPYITST